MFRFSKWRVLVFTGAATSLLVITESFGREMIVNDVRPVATAVQNLANEFKVPITYEDPPYWFPGDLEDVTFRVVRQESVAAALARGERIAPIISMKERELRFRYEPPKEAPAIDLQARAAVQSAIDANNSSYPPALFELRQAGGRLHATPEKVKNERGEYFTYKPLLDAIISIESQDRSAAEFVDVFCSAVSRATGTPVRSGIVINPSYWLRERTTLGGGEKPARDLLLEFLMELESRIPDGAKFSWSLLTDIGSFALNFHVVRPSSPHEQSSGVKSFNRGNKPQPLPGSKTKAKPQTRGPEPGGARLGAPSN